MAQPLIAGLPPGLELVGGYTLRLTALDPTTGAVVTAVKVSSMVAMVDTGGAPIPDVPGYTVTPLLAYTPGIT